MRVSPPLNHYPIEHNGYILNVWYYHISAKYGQLIEVARQSFKNAGVEWSGDMQELFDQVRVLGESLAAERVDLLVKRRLGFVQRRLQEAFERNPDRPVDFVQITSPGQIIVSFKGGIRCEIGVDLSCPRYRRVRIRRVTEADKAHTLAQKNHSLTFVGN